MLNLCDTCLACAPSCRALIGNVKSFIDNMKLGEAATSKEDPNSPSEILKLVPDEFLLDHLAER